MLIAAALFFLGVRISMDRGPEGRPNMVSLYSLIIFFFILVIVYSLVSLVLIFLGWCRKYWIGRKQVPAHDLLCAIDARTDRLKSKAFTISVLLVLFCVMPFVILYFLVL